ncbi:MAG: hypothetical protein JXP73_05115 [Deltaproteobacteria bacterium]|jgi:hypothetical protein|nr:hypothetical protein [Deltaproteobacteria bacterium]
MHGWRRQLIIVAAGVVSALAIVVVRLLLDAHTALANGAEAELRGDTAAAIRHYMDAGRLYVPGSPFTRDALDHLDSMAVAAVTRGDYQTARAAFEAERAAILSTRSFYSPYQSRLPSLELRLARLLAASEGRAALSAFDKRASWHQARLAQRPGPHTGWVLLALLGLATWVSSGVLFFRHGLDSRFGLRRVPAVLAASGFVLGLGLFLIGLRLA